MDACQPLAEMAMRIRPCRVGQVLRICEYTNWVTAELRMYMRMLRNTNATNKR